jgi:hypothetical protein
VCVWMSDVGFAQKIIKFFRDKKKTEFAAPTSRTSRTSFQVPRDLPPQSVHGPNPNACYHFRGFTSSGLLAIKLIFFTARPSITPSFAARSFT